MKWLEELSQNWDESINVRNSPRENFQLLIVCGAFALAEYRSIPFLLTVHHKNFLEETPKVHFNDSFSACLTCI